MRVALAAAKASGTDFDRAWQQAFDGLRRPTDRPMWVAWSEVLNETKPAWRDAYDDVDRRPYRALRALVSV